MPASFLQGICTFPGSRSAYPSGRLGAFGIYGKLHRHGGHDERVRSWRDYRYGLACLSDLWHRLWRGGVVRRLYAEFPTQAARYAARDLFVWLFDMVEVKTERSGTPRSLSSKPLCRTAFDILGEMKKRIVLLPALIFLSSSIIAACGFIPQFINGGIDYRNQLHDQIPGPGMMRNWPDNMPGPGMMYGDTSPPPAVTPAPTVTAGGDSKTSFYLDIQPILDRECIVCHGGQAGLYLESYDYLMAGSTNGPVVVPGNPSASELVKWIQGLNQPVMPLGADPLSPSEIELMILWIAEGSPNN